MLLAGGLELVELSGRDLGPELLDFVYECYVSTVSKYYWGRQYLNRAFFEEICSRIPESILVVLARHVGTKRPVACAFNLVDGADGLAGVAAQISVDTMGRTTVPGIYAAGDIVEYQGKVKLIATGFGEAATAVNNIAVMLNPEAHLFPGHSSNVE